MIASLTTTSGRRAGAVLGVPAIAERGRLVVLGPEFDGLTLRRDVTACSATWTPKKRCWTTAGDGKST